MKKIFILLLLLTQMVLGISAQDADSISSKNFLTPGTEAPDFTLMAGGGQKFELSSMRGRYVVIEFWASWCGDCRNIRSRMDQLSKDCNIDSIVFVGVSYDTDKDAWMNYLKSDIKDQIIQVSELRKWKETETSQQYGIKWIPTMYLIDPAGKVVMATTDVEMLAKALKDIDKSKITSEKQNHEKIFNLMGGVFPQYKGGIPALIQFLSSNIKYPEYCDSYGITGKVYVQFVVDETGELENISVIKTEVQRTIRLQLTIQEQTETVRKCGMLFQAEAIRVVEKMKDWIPATRYGHPVKVKFTLPVTFKLK